MHRSRGGKGSNTVVSRKELLLLAEDAGGPMCNRERDIP